VRPLLAMIVLAALAAAGSGVHGSRAAFTATGKNPANTFTTAADFAPAVTVTAPAAGAYTNDTTPTFSGAAGTATGDSTTITVRIYSGAAATGTVVQTRTAARSGAAWTNTLTTALAQGTYTARVTQADNAGNTGSATVTFTVDTSAPTPAMVSAANATGGTKGRIGAGDSITYTFSEAIAPASVLSTFAGGSTSAAVQVYIYNAGTTDYIALLDSSGQQNVKLDTYVATNADLATANIAWPATLTQSADGRSFTVTLGTAPATGVATTVNVARNMVWTAKAGPTDRAGNALSISGTIAETDTDVDF
jgi:hypothetical protein